MISLLRAALALPIIFLAVGCTSRAPEKRNLTLVQKQRPLGPPSYFYRSGSAHPEANEQAIAHTRQ